MSSPSSPSPQAIAINLTHKIQAVCPVISVFIVDPATPSTWSFQPDPSATAPQIAAGQAIINSYVTAGVPPDQVQMWQFQAQLDTLGQFNAANSYVNAHQSTLPDLFHWWNRAAVANRFDNNVALLQTQLSMTDAAMDALFVAASAKAP